MAVNIQNCYSLEDETQEYLKEMIERGQIIRVGATTDPERRRKEYQREGYRGTMICAKTQNMKKAENKLLEACRTCTANIQRSSNVVAEKPGYVYGIKP